MRGYKKINVCQPDFQYSSWIYLFMCLFFEYLGNYCQCYLPRLHFDEPNVSLLSGGWLLVSNIVITSLPLQLSVKPSYRGIGSYRNKTTVLTKSAMNELWTHLSFTQLRFHCRKQKPGRTFHVTTVSNSIGEAVVQYFSGQTDVLPPSCNSFFKMDDDNSKAARVCEDWGVQNGKKKKLVNGLGLEKIDQDYTSILSLFGKNITG